MVLMVRMESDGKNQQTKVFTIFMSVELNVLIELLFFLIHFSHIIVEIRHKNLFDLTQANKNLE